MTQDLIKWDIYEISTTSSALTGVMLRGRIRKFGLQNNLNILVENTTDVEARVRVALIHGTKIDQIKSFLESIISDAKLELKLESVSNPVLSKLKVNIESRYQI